MTRLPFVRSPTSQAHAVSPEGIVVGSDDDITNEDVEGVAWVWENGTIQRLPELVDGSIPFRRSSANGVNLAGNIVGYSEIAGGAIGPDSRMRAVLWQRQ